MIYKVNFQLGKADSLIIEMGKNTSADFLQITSDTLHGFLNIYVQKKENMPAGKAGKLVNVFRINKFFKQTAAVEDIDVARLNSISAFETGIFYNGKDVYTIKSVSDTSGKQFYLNKYKLKSDLTNFEYENKWQFPFERKNINSARIVFADTLIVLLYVNVISGNKRGEWILKINTRSGLFLKGTKINDTGDNSFYSYGKMLYDTSLKLIYVQGQKFSEKELNQSENKINLCNKPHLTIYLASIDSAGHMLTKEEFKIPVTEAKGTVNKTPVNYLIRTNKMSKSKEGDFLVETDVFKSHNNELCYSYCNSNNLKLLNADGKLTLEKTAINTNPLVEKYYLSTDKLDMNGKLCIDSLLDFEKLFYNSLTFNVKGSFKLDDLNNPLWLLKKTDSKKNIQNYSFLIPVKKIYQIVPVLEINKAEEPALTDLDKKRFIISKQTLTDRFQLQLFNW